jgi:hypothetical protein
MDKKNDAIYELHPLWCILPGEENELVFFHRNKGAYKLTLPPHVIDDFAILLTRGGTISAIDHSVSRKLSKSEKKQYPPRRILKALVLLNALWIATDKNDKYRRLYPIESYIRATKHPQDVSGLIDEITDSHVAIIGCGSLGAPTSCHLVQFGISKLVLIDGDRVSIENISRQIILDESDVGKYKADALKQKLLRLAPITKVDTICKYLLDETAVDNILRNYLPIDIIVLTADEPAFEIVLWVTRFCKKNEIVLLRGNSLAIGPIYIPREQTPCPCCYGLPADIGTQLPKVRKKFVQEGRKRHSIGPSMSPTIAATELANIVFDYLCSKATYGLKTANRRRRDGCPGCE